MACFSQSRLLICISTAFLLLVSISAAEERVPMTNKLMGELLTKEFGADKIEGRDGAWRITVPELEDDAEPADDKEKEEADEEAEDKDADKGDDKEQGEDEDADDADDKAKEEELPSMIVVLTDERADRMRLMMPIRKFSTDNLQDLQLALIALHANFDRALDARYAIQGGVLWSVFIHPLESLTEGDLKNGLNQVRMLRKNTGTTYTSSELLFGGAAPQAPQLPEELQEFD